VHTHVTRYGERVSVGGDRRERNSACGTAMETRERDDALRRAVHHDRVADRVAHGDHGRLAMLGPGALGENGVPTVVRLCRLPNETRQGVRGRAAEKRYAPRKRAVRLALQMGRRFGLVAMR